MVIDYRDVSFSFREKKKKQLRRRIKIGIFALILFGGYLFIRHSGNMVRIKTIQNHLLQRQF